MVELPNFFIATPVAIQLYEFSRKSRSSGSCCFSSDVVAFKSNACTISTSISRLHKNHNWVNAFSEADTKGDEKDPVGLVSSKHFKQKG